MLMDFFDITPKLAYTLIAEQFPEYANLSIRSVEKQGHDNCTYRLGEKMLIRMPRAQVYALKVPKEQELLPKLASQLSLNIPVPIAMGKPSEDYPYPFSIYQWLAGNSLNLLLLDQVILEQIAFDLAKFLKELQSITDVLGPAPGQHNFWRGDHISIYDRDAREQILLLAGSIDSKKAMDLWGRACNTRWKKRDVWVHGDVAMGNILVLDRRIVAIIDFGGMALGDPACDLVMAWTYFSGKARDIFVRTMDLDEDTWLRARGWALWKATFELCQLDDKNSSEAMLQKKIIEEVIETA